MFVTVVLFSLEITSKALKLLTNPQGKLLDLGGGVEWIEKGSEISDCMQQWWGQITTTAKGK